MKCNIGNYPKIIIIYSVFQIILGTLLLISEVHDFIKLPTTQEADIAFGGVVDLYKYQENTYVYIYYAILMISTGLSLCIDKKSYWVANQILLVTSVLAFMTFFGNHLYLLTLPIIQLVNIIMIIYCRYALGKTKLYPTGKLVATAIGVISAAYCWFLIFI